MSHRHLLFCAILLMVSLSPTVLCQEGAALNKESKSESGYLKRAMLALPRWGAAPFSQAQWSQYMRLAYRMQISDRSAVSAAMSDYCREDYSNAERTSEGAPGSAAFILNQIIFDQSVAVEGMPSINSGFFQGPSEPKGWPVQWDITGPSLIGFYNGRDGLPYDGGVYFLAYLQWLPFREISADGAAKPGSFGAK